MRKKAKDLIPLVDWIRYNEKLQMIIANIRIDEWRGMVGFASSVLYFHEIVSLDMVYYDVADPEESVFILIS